MPKAKTAKDYPAAASAKAKGKANRSMTQKTFDDLSPAEKDELLKLVAERLGLIKES